jgi:hypothetical protein
MLIEKNDIKAFSKEIKKSKRQVLMKANENGFLKNIIKNVLVLIRL